MCIRDSPLPVALAHARLVMDTLRSSEVETPESASLAYDVQDQLSDLIDSPSAGWKVGATSPVSQEKLGVKTPICGPVFQRTIFDSGDSVDLSAFHHQPGLESEFAFTIGLTVRPGGPAMSALMAREMVSTVHVAIELVCSRFEENFEVDPALLVADGALHAGLVLGPGWKPETVPDLVSHQLRTLVDGDEVAVGTGVEVLGDPYESLAWLCNHLNKRGLILPSGSVVTTGAATGLHATGAGQEVMTDGGALGSVTLNLVG